MFLIEVEKLCPISILFDFIINKRSNPFQISRPVIAASSLSSKMLMLFFYVAATLLLLFTHLIHFISNGF